MPKHPREAENRKPEPKPQDFLKQIIDWHEFERDRYSHKLASIEEPTRTEENIWRTSARIHGDSAAHIRDILRREFHLTTGN